MADELMRGLFCTQFQYVWDLDGGPLGAVDVDFTSPTAIEISVGDWELFLSPHRLANHVMRCLTEADRYMQFEGDITIWTTAEHEIFSAGPESHHSLHELCEQVAVQLGWKSERDAPRGVSSPACVCEEDPRRRSR